MLEWLGLSLHGASLASGLVACNGLRLASSSLVVIGVAVNDFRLSGLVAKRRSFRIARG